MIYIKNPKNNNDITIKLDENTEFYTECNECGKVVEATKEILDDFTGFLYGSTILYCEECTAKRKN